MVDINTFKKTVKAWIVANPEGTLASLELMCESWIPAKAYTANRWLIRETLGYYENILSNRKDEQTDSSEIA